MPFLRNECLKIFEDLFTVTSFTAIFMNKLKTSIKIFLILNNRRIQFSKSSDFIISEYLTDCIKNNSLPTHCRVFDFFHTFLPEAIHIGFVADHVPTVQ